ncbi:MAG: ParA family protein [Chloroflexota bacterium]
MARIIAISLSKGGVGKTTTAVNLAAGLVEAGKRVLLVDTDTQGQVSNALGLEASNGLYDLVMGEADMRDVLIQARSELFVITGGQNLARLKRTISQAEYEGEYTLDKAIEPIKQYFDYIIFDTAPSWDVLNVNVLFTAQEVLCPVNLEILAVQGLFTFIQRLAQIGKRSGVQLKYVLPTSMDRRVAQTSEILEQLRQRLPKHMCDPIRYNIRLSEAPAHGQHIFEYAPSSNGAEDYRNLTQRILNDE